MLTIRLFLITIFIFLCSFLTACHLTQKEIVEQGVIIAEKAPVRNSTGLVAATIKEVNRGEVVGIIERRNANQQDFVHVRLTGEKPIEGWIESRFIISKKIIDECNKLATEWKDIPTQATGKNKDKLKLRLSPSRNSEVVTLLTAGTKIEVVGRVRAERQSETNDKNEKSNSESKDKYDTWYKVRLDNPIIKAGWLYADSVELTPPDSITALPGAGRKFVAWQAFGEITDSETKNNEKNYIILDKYAYSKEEDIDFDRIYVVAWDTETHAYKSIHIESQVKGLYPLKVEQETSGYLFNVSLLDKQKNPILARYKITGDAATNKWTVSRVVEPKPSTKTIKKSK